MQCHLSLSALPLSLLPPTPQWYELISEGALFFLCTLIFLRYLWIIDEIAKKWKWMSIEIKFQILWKGHTKFGKISYFILTLLLSKGKSVEETLMYNSQHTAKFEFFYPQCPLLRIRLLFLFSQNTGSANPHWLKNWVGKFLKM